MLGHEKEIHKLQTFQLLLQKEHLPAQLSNKSHQLKSDLVRASLAGV